MKMYTLVTNNPMRAYKMKEEYHYWPADLLVQYIVKDYHAQILLMVREIKVGLRQLIATHGVSYPLLYEVYRQYLLYAEALASHLSKEAIAVLPYAKRYSQELKKQSCLRKPGLFSVCHSIDVMYTEHQSGRRYIEGLLDLMDHVEIQDNERYQGIYRALQEMSSCWQELVHLENDILFPKLVEMESTLKPI